jgi:hypothetical protein
MGFTVPNPARSVAPARRRYVFDGQRAGGVASLLLRHFTQVAIVSIHWRTCLSLERSGPSCSDSVPEHFLGNWSRAVLGREALAPVQSAIYVKRRRNGSVTDAFMAVKWLGTEDLRIGFRQICRNPIQQTKLRSCKARTAK